MLHIAKKFAGFIIFAMSASAQVFAANIPRFDHVVIAVMENHRYDDIIGSASAPYINSLAMSGVNFTASFAVTHPSEPNYLAMFSGSTQNVTDDACPLSFPGVNNLGAQLIAAGLTFVGYSEDLPQAGSTVCLSGASGYARKHSPWVNFDNVPAASNQPFTAFPSTYSTLPAIAFVIPNLCNDMHDCTIATGDTWLQTHLDGYIQWAKTHNSLFILTWDEDDFTAINRIVTVFAGANLVPGQYSEVTGHYRMLATMEAMYGLAPLGGAVGLAPISDIWNTIFVDGFQPAAAVAQ
ncbi:MAG: alkaline phosphatase family protein [Dokdonella sp.]